MVGSLCRSYGGLAVDRSCSRAARQRLLVHLLLLKLTLWPWIQLLGGTYLLLLLLLVCDVVCPVSKAPLPPRVVLGVHALTGYGLLPL